MHIATTLTSEYIEIAPGHVKISRSRILNKICEELAFPHLLGKSQFGYKTEHETKLSLVKYFNQKLQADTFLACGL